MKIKEFRFASKEMYEQELRKIIEKMKIRKKTDEQEIDLEIEYEKLSDEYVEFCEHLFSSWNTHTKKRPQKREAKN